MAQIVVGSYMVRYPLGGMLNWVLQYLVGFARLGHEVWFVEKAGWPDACFDPSQGVMTDDATYGTSAVDALLRSHDLAGRWCFVDRAGQYHGASRVAIEGVLGGADVFVDMGTHGSWLEEAATAGVRVLIDGEPGFTQMKMAAGTSPTPANADAYDAWYTTGPAVADGTSTAPSCGIPWRPLWHPVVADLYADAGPTPTAAPFTTVMNWQSYDAFIHDGLSYGHKDRSFPAFEQLPELVDVPLELAVSGRDVPRDRLTALGWNLRDAHAVTVTVASFTDYIAGSAGEVGVCKHGFVEADTGWFSDRSAAYLATGRPVVLQDTGFSRYLPTGHGLFGVSDADGAAAALGKITADPAYHAEGARAVAHDVLDARHVLGRMLDDL